MIPEEEIENVETKDFETVEEMIHEYFNPLRQNKQIMKEASTFLMQKKKSVRSNTATANQLKEAGSEYDQRNIKSLASLDMKEIGTTETLQRLIKKSTSNNR